MNKAPHWLRENIEAISGWVQDAYPYEGCGLILDARVWKPCQNLADLLHKQDPKTFPRTAKTSYVINPLEFVKAEDQGQRVTAVVHSHADVGDYFSAADMAGALMPPAGDASVAVAAFPGVDYLVVSVRSGRVDHARLFRFRSGQFECVFSGAISGVQIQPD